MTKKYEYALTRLLSKQCAVHKSFCGSLFIQMTWERLFASLSTQRRIKLVAAVIVLSTSFLLLVLRIVKSIDWHVPRGRSLASESSSCCSPCLAPLAFVGARINNPGAGTNHLRADSCKAKRNAWEGRILEGAAIDWIGSSFLAGCFPSHVSFHKFEQAFAAKASASPSAAVKKWKSLAQKSINHTHRSLHDTPNQN